MWPFNKPRASVGKKWLNGATDYHTHILPGVDDGIEDMKQAVEVLKAYERWGVRAVWLTPHVMEDCPNATSALRERFYDLTAAYQAVCGPSPVSLHLGAEYMLDACFSERLEAGDLLTVADSRHLLVETSYFSPPLMFDKLLKRISQKGYTVLLAHPERYRYMEMSDYENLRDRGVRMQLDVTSLAGEFGVESQRRACILLKKGFYDLAGSDLHSLSVFKEWINAAADKATCQLLQSLSLHKKESI